MKKSAYSEYLLGNWAVEFFKDKIQKLDVENIYNRKSETLGMDPKDVKAFKLSPEYCDKEAQWKILMKEWQMDHQNYYRTQPCLPSSPLLDNFTLSYPDISLEEAIQGYKAAKELLKSISNESLNPYCVEMRPMLNAEHREEYQKYSNMIKKKIGMPTDEEINSMLPEKKCIKYRLSLNRQKSDNPLPMNHFRQEANEILSKLEEPKTVE